MMSTHQTRSICGEIANATEIVCRVGRESDAARQAVTSAGASPAR